MALCLMERLFIMTCYHPLKAFETGWQTSTGKKEIVVTSHFKDALPIKEAVKRFGHDYPYNPEFMKIDCSDMVFYKVQNVPCGHCIGCRLDKARDWATRCMLEASLYEENYFITLTYDNDHLPKNGKISKRDIQLFNKRLRKEYGDGIRFFLCGEYGETFKRPHYHGIYFNLHLDDLVKIADTSHGKYYSSEKLARVWKNGFVLVGECSFKSAGYVARYSMKSFNVETDFKPFLLMSRNPGIGHDWIKSNLVKVYSTDKIYFDFGDKHVSSSNRYFDSQLEKIYPELLQDWKDVRRWQSEISQTGELIAHEFSEIDNLLDFMEKKKKRQIERLKRS